jgi:hypothetical protein
MFAILSEGAAFRDFPRPFATQGMRSSATLRSDGLVIWSKLGLCNMLSNDIDTLVMVRLDASLDNCIS